MPSSDRPSHSSRGRGGSSRPRGGGGARRRDGRPSGGQGRGGRGRPGGDRRGRPGGDRRDRRGGDRRDDGRRDDGDSRRSGGRGRPDGRRGSSPRRDGRPSGGQGRGGRGRPGGDRRRDSRSGGGYGRGGQRGGHQDRGRPEPRTEAERRAAEVRKRRGPRPERSPEDERAKIESRELDTWIDEGSVRDEAIAATQRASGGPSSSRRPRELAPEVAIEVQQAVDPQRAKRLVERLAAASDALDRERYEQARRMATALVKELPTVAAVHEVKGLAAYRLGRWKEASSSLELALELREEASLLPVLADCYRAQRRFLDVDAVWLKVRQMSPSHDIMAEARIVAAGALADQGNLAGAIALMEPATSSPKRVRDHHLRQWYVIADLYDRAGDTMSASRWFTTISSHNPEFSDVKSRLRSLGR